MPEKYEIPNDSVIEHGGDKRATRQVSMAKYIEYWEQRGVPSWKSMVSHDAKEWQRQRDRE